MRVKCQAHNLKVVGSNPTPATNYLNKINKLKRTSRTSNLRVLTIKFLQ